MKNVCPCLLLLLISGFGFAAEIVSADATDGDLVTRSRALNYGDVLHLSGLDLAQPGQIMVVKRFQVWADDARIIVHGDGDTQEIGPPNHTFFTGTVDGLPGSKAYLRVNASGEMRGLVAARGRFWMLARRDQTLTAFEMDPSATSVSGDFKCEADLIDQDQRGPAPGIKPVKRGYTPVRGGGGSYNVRVAAETDFEFYQLFGNSTDAADYIADLIGFNSGVYAAEADANLVLGDVSLWTNSGDPWEKTSSSCAFYEFGGYWNANKTGVQRSIAHFFSGKNTGGGIGWVGVLCRGAFTTDSGSCGLAPQIGSYGGDYAFSGGLAGNFDIGNPQSVWDIVVVGHEIGHNFDSPHTHCYAGIGGNANPIDECYGSQNGCYSGATSLPCGTPGGGCGTIMSYCHLLSGGLNNISLTLGEGHAFGIAPERVPAEMNAHVIAVNGSNPSCLTSASCTNPIITATSSDPARCVGASVTLTVTADNATGYQWQKGGVNIGGATSASYTIDPVALDDEAGYACVVSNSCGSVTSGTISLTVYPPTQITASSSNQTLCAGETANFSVTASGHSLTYQWRKGGVDISGATAATYAINSVTSGDGGAYTCVVTGSCGMVTSGTITLSVADSVQIVGEPVNSSACVGETADFVVSTSGGQGAVSYQWFFNGGPIGGATSATLSLDNVDLGDAGDYYCRISDDCGTLQSATRSLTVGASPLITGQPSSAVRCAGDSVSFTVSVSGAGLSYQWQHNMADIPGATNATFTIALIAGGDAGDYRCNIGSDCGSITSSSVSLTVTAGTFGVSASASDNVQGINLITLDGDVVCGSSATVEWVNQTAGFSYGVGNNPVVLDDYLTETTTFEISADNGDSVVTDQMVVTAAGNSSFYDLNGDGCNDINDLYYLLEEWRTVGPLDANGDGIINLLDLMFINISGGCP